jgi:hypothetical protein
MKMQKYTVMREHFGEKSYVKGDDREAEPSDVAHLVSNGVLQLKAETPLLNKAMQAPSNKAK